MSWISKEDWDTQKRWEKDILDKQKLDPRVRQLLFLNDLIKKYNEEN